MKSKGWVYFCVTCLVAAVLCPVLSQGDIEPTSLEATLTEGESVLEAKTVTITGEIPKADILFAFDLTGSMGDEIDVVKAEATAIMTALDGLIGDARYGVMSFMDYTNHYVSCGYAAWYGDEDSGDYPYLLDLPLTDDRTLVANTINGLVLCNGSDGPQDYTRVMYESYADPNIGYRPGAKKILILFGDNVPHDCNVYEGASEVPLVWSTGADPGRDEIVGTADDLDLQEVLAQMASSNVTLLKIYSGYPGDFDLWEHWAAMTGGDAYPLAGADDVPEAIVELIEGEALHLNELTLKVTTAGYEGWLTQVTPAAYSNIDIPAEGELEFEFTIEITVREGCCAQGGADHSFVVSAIGDGASYGDQDVTIHVVCPERRVGAMNEPGSVLVFPLVHNAGGAKVNGGRKTILDMSNLGDEDVWLQGFMIYRYVDALGVRGKEFIKKDFYVHLTAHEPFHWDTSRPYDRVDEDGVRTQIQGFEGAEGFCFVWAIDGRATKMEKCWDYLKGDALILEDGRAYQYNAIPHQCRNVVPDRVLNLDGIEYTGIARQIMAEGFAGGVVDGGELAVCSLDIDFVRSIQPRFDINVDVWNQQEVPQSRHLDFYQFERYDLMDDLQLGRQHIFTAKWELAATATGPMWAVQLQHKGARGMGVNVWQHRGAPAIRPDGVPTDIITPADGFASPVRVILPPVPKSYAPQAAPILGGREARPCVK